MNKKYAKVKSTKRALMMSALSLMLSVAMLLGTTYAWFTDSVTSGTNQIVAGNLDIEVEYKNQVNGKWENLQDSASVFSQGLWEPGHTEFVTLKITNKGTLALIYKTLVTSVSENGGINVYGEAFKLSDYLVFATTEPSDTEPVFATREAAREAAGTEYTLDVNALTRNGTLKSGETEYITLVVYMPEEVDNHANYKTGTAAPTIELGITVKATQETYEKDSFDDKYDKDAASALEYVAGAYYEYFEAIVAKDVSGNDRTFEIEKTVGDTNVAGASGVTENPGDTVTMTVVKSAEAEQKFTTVLADGTVKTGYDIKVTGQEPGSLVQCQLYVGTGLEEFKFYHNNVEMTPGTKGDLKDGESYYDKEEGIVYFATITFSPFVGTYKAPEAAIGATPYGTLQAAIDAAKDGDTVKFLKDIALTDFVSVKKAIVIEGANHTLNRTNMVDNRGAFDYWLGNDGLIADLTVKNLTIKNDSTVQGYAAVAGMGGETVKFDNCRFENLYCAVISNGCNGTEKPSVEITNCQFVNTTWGNSYYRADYQNPPIISNITGLTPDKYVEIFPGTVAAVYSSNGQYVDQYATLQEAIANANAGAKIFIMPGTYTGDVVFPNPTNAVNLIGADKATTIINGQIQYKAVKGETVQNVTIKNLTVNNAGKEGLKISGWGDTANAGNPVVGANITVDNCAFNGCSFGISINGYADNYDVTVTNCDFSTADCGVCVRTNHEGFEEDTFANNTVTFGAGNTVNPDGFAIQTFNGKNGYAFNFYFRTIADYASFTNPCVLVGNESALNNALSGDTNGKIIVLSNDITVTAPLPNISGKNITIDGNNKTVSFDHGNTRRSLFGNDTNPLYAGTLTVKNATFVDTNEGNATSPVTGFVAQTGYNSTASVTCENCTFRNLWCAVYLNPGTGTLVIKNCTYENCKYGYSKDHGTYAVTFEGNTEIDNEIFGN